MAVRLAEGVAWALVCLGVWLATLSTITWEELVVGGSAAVLCGAAAVGGRILVSGRWTMRWRWLGWFWRLALTAPIEMAQALWAVVRRQSGRSTTLGLPKREAAYVAASRRGIGTLLICASPGSYVFDADPRERRLSVHRLGRGAPAAVRMDLNGR